MEKKTYKKRGMRTRGDNPNAKHFLNNADLLRELALSKEEGKPTKLLLDMLMLLPEKYSYKSNFKGYSFREDMVAEARINLLRNWMKFDPEKSNQPFSYFTMATHRVFLGWINEEKKHRDIQNQLLNYAGQTGSMGWETDKREREDPEHEK